MTLVFGSTGFLGKTFFLEPVPPNLIAADRGRYDFSKPLTPAFLDFLTSSRAKSAIILTAISSPDDCLQDPAYSEAVNVAGTVALLKELKARKIKPVFFSTDHVFDGEQGNYREDDAYTPVTLYGRQKVRTEMFIRETFSDYLILRTSKQVAMRVDDKNTLSEMALKLLAGAKIRCATDNWVAPSFVEDIALITLQALAANLCGVFHIAPEAQYSRLELGHLIADSVGASHSLVEPCSIKDFRFLEIRPPRCTLDGAKLREVLGFTMTTLQEGLRKLSAQLPFSPR